MRSKFQTASSMIGLNSRISKLDNLVGFIPKGKVVFIEGTRSRKHILEVFCLRALIQYQNYCIFVDGGNGFDPYLLSKLATINRENPREILSRVIISRAFTCHQLASLINDVENRRDTIAMITSDEKNEWLSGMVELYSDIILRVHENKVELNKHPTRPNASIEFASNDLTLQNKPEIEQPLTMESWLIVNG